MSVTSTVTSVSYEYAEGQIFSLPFQCQAPSDVKASYINDDGNTEILTYGVDYNVSENMVEVQRKLAAGIKITFYRQTRITQQTELPAQTITKSIETAIDRNTMCIQELDEAHNEIKIEFSVYAENLNQKMADFNENFDEFKSSINQSLNEFKAEVNKTVEVAVTEVKEIKETAIAEMNEIKDETKNIATNVNVFFPSVDNGVLSWTNPAGIENPASVNIQGPAATITIGTVSTGEPGSSASVTNVGTDTAAVLAITIPRGDKGVDGTGAGDVVSTSNNTFTATNTFGEMIKTNSDMQAVGELPIVLQRGDSNIQVCTLNDSASRSLVFSDTGDMTGYAKTFIISVARAGGTGTFSIGSNNAIGTNTPAVYIMDGTLPDIADGEVLKIAMEVSEPANAIFIYILGKVAL